MVPSSSQLYGEGGGALVNCDGRGGQFAGAQHWRFLDLRLLLSEIADMWPANGVVAAAYKCFVTANLGGCMFVVFNSGAAQEVAWLSRLLYI